jgi:hypothetical protein
VTDIALLLGTLAFFAISIAYVAGCDAIIARDRRAGPGGRS